jgi:iron complex outermembrane receptor protein
MHTLLRSLRALATGALLVLTAHAAEPARKSYDLPAGDAAVRLKQFSETSGRETLFAAEAVRGVRTTAVKGEFTPKEALDHMLDGTGLVAVQDEKTGALAVRRDPDPNAPRAAQTDSDRPTSPSKVEDGKLVLDKYQVTGRMVDGLNNKGLFQTGPEAALYQQIIGRAEIERMGITSIEELFRLLPQTTTTITALQSSDGFTSRSSGVGLAPSTTSLRGFSSGQTVVLINGRALPASNISGGGADLSRIPVAAIERVEVMPYAASTIYGSGAVGGAINIILRKNYSGQDVTTYYGTTTGGGATEYRVTLLDGRTYGQGRTSVTLTFDYQHRDALRAGQRDYLATFIQRYPPGTPQFYSTGLAALSSAPGVITGGSNPTLRIPGVNGVRWAQIPAGTTAEQSTALTPDSFVATAGAFSPTNRHGRSILYNPQDSYNFNAQIDHHFLPEGRLDGYAELTYNFRRQDLTYPEFTGISLAATDPLNPFRTGVTPGYVGQAVTLFFDPVDLPDSRALMEYAATRAVLGLKGKLADKWEWSADATVDYNESHVSNYNPAAAINNIVAPLTLSSATAATASVRRAIYPLLADHNRYPVSQTDIDKYFDYRSRINNRTYNYEGNARITGELINLPAGPLETSWVGTARRVTADLSSAGQISEALAQLQNGLPASDPANVNPFVSQVWRDTGRLALEAKIPVLGKKWRPIPVESLELNFGSSYEVNRTGGDLNLGSTRASHIRTTELGSATNLVAAKLQLVPDVALRASYSQGVYVPDWNSVGASVLVQVLPGGFFTDPARGNTFQSTNWTYLLGGNPNLKPESDNSTNLGVILKPRFLPGLTLAVDYWRTNKQDAIQTPTFRTIMARPDSYPGRVVRAPATPEELALGWAGVVTLIDATAINIGRVRTDGIDTRLSYDWRTESMGAFRFDGNASFTNHFQTQAAQGPWIELVGSDGSPLRWRGYGSVTWTKADFGVTLAARYTDHYYSATTAKSAAFPNGNGLDGGRIPAFMTYDVQFTYEVHHSVERGWRNWIGGTKWTLGCLNFPDRAPTPVTTASAFYNRYDDPRQRFVYLQIKKSL